MKKIFLSVLMASVTITGVYAQSANNSTAPTQPKSSVQKQVNTNREKKIEAAANVPDAVKQNFTTAFPSVKNNSAWKVNDKGFYETHFADGTNTKFVKYDTAGKLVQTKESMAVSSLPSSISDYVNKNYPGATISSAYNVTDNIKNVNYLRIKTTSNTLIFDANGNFKYEAGKLKPLHQGGRK